MHSPRSEDREWPAQGSLGWLKPPEGKDRLNRRAISGRRDSPSSLGLFSALTFHYFAKTNLKIELEKTKSGFLDRVYLLANETPNH